MDIKSLETAMHEFVASKGWYDADSPRPQTLKNLSISLVLEATEVLEHFQWAEESRNPDALASELADVMLYLLQLASLSQINLGEAVLNKLAVNQNRSWDTDSHDTSLA